MNNQWSKYRPLSKLDQLAETILKTAFIMSENHHVIQSYAEHKGANFRVINRVPASAKATAGRGEEREFDVLCRQINIERLTMPLFLKRTLNKV